MQQLLISSIQKRTAIGVMAIALLFGMMGAAQPAQAQAPAQNDLQAQIAQLLQMVASLQAQVQELKNGSSESNTSSNETGLEGGFTDRNISVGALIQTTDSLKVRARGAANGALLEVQNPFSRGTVIAGPRSADGYTWWQIRYANGRVGWSAENWLRGRAAAPTVDVPNDNEESEEEDRDDVTSVKCTIESSTRVVTRGDRFEIDWYTDLVNPALIDERGERSVKKSGTRRYVARTEGTQQYAIGSSKDGIACSVDITVIAEEEEEEEEELVRVDRDDVCPYTWTRTLQSGNSGADVRFLKQFLNSDSDTAVYYEDGFSRVFNDELATAINKFQVKYRAAILSPLGYVNPTGTFNPSTMAKANSLCVNGDANDDDALRAMIDDLIDQINKQETDTPTEDEVEDMSEAELRAQINTLLAKIAAQNDANKDYDIDIEAPRNGTSFAPGDTIRIIWDQDNLSTERGVVTLEGGPYNVERHIKRNVSLADGRTSVRIPTGDRYLRAGNYELKLWVSYIKDGDSKDVSDAVDVKITSADNPTGVYKGYIDGRNFITTNTITQSAAYENCELNARHNQTKQIYCTWEGRIIFDNRNDNQDTLDVGDAEKKAMILSILSQMQNNPNAESPNLEELYEQARLLASQLTSDKISFLERVESVYESLRAEIAAESDDFWKLDRDDNLYLVGAYEGTYPDGVRHSGGYHPQGEITLNMDKQSGQATDTMLVLTAYEPVLWKLEGDATEYVTRVFLSGYYDQEIVGIGDDVEVIHMSHQSGDSGYFYAYEEDSDNFSELNSFLRNKTGISHNLWYGSGYTLNEVYLGLKG